MPDTLNPEHEAEARRILSHPGSLEELEYHRDRLVTLRFKFLADNPSLKDHEVKNLLPEFLKPGSPLPGMFSTAVTRGAVLRLRDLERRIALYERAIEQKRHGMKPSGYVTNGLPGEVTVTVAGVKRTDSREGFVIPILETKGWSIFDWAKESEVDFHTANDYLKGRTNPYRSTRKKLAESLGLKAEQLPL